jgi:hypothetical protein
MSFWEWFKTGAFSAVVWNLFRNPGSCACRAALLVGGDRPGGNP